MLRYTSGQHRGVSVVFGVGNRAHVQYLIIEPSYAGKTADEVGIHSLSDNVDTQLKKNNSMSKQTKEKGGSYDIYKSDNGWVVFFYHSDPLEKSDPVRKKVKMIVMMGTQP